VLLKYSIRGAGYGEGPAIIEDVAADLGEGGLLVLAGPSGSGKTTTLLAITGVLNNLLYGWVEGESWIAGINPLSPEGFDEIPTRIGAVLQDPDKQLAMPTPYSEVAFTLENLGYPEHVIREKTVEMLERLGLRDKMYAHVEDLSGGEKRRLTFASAVVHDPPLLLLDEPSASMDPWGIREVRGFISDWRRRGKGVLVVEHKLRYFLWDGARIQVYRGGRVVRELEAPLSRGEIRFLEEIGVDAGPPRIRRVKPPTGSSRVLEARGLVIGYGENIVARDIDLYLDRGEAVAIIGRNGAGKTTLLKTLAGGLDPLDGEVLLLEEKTFSRQRIGRVFYVPQTPDYLFVAPSLEGEVREIAGKTGKPVDWITRYIPWYGEARKTSPYRLSHGQRRWLSIIIAYSYGAPVILLDEPSSGLDLRLFRRLAGLVGKLRGEGVSFLISTHDPRVVGEMCSRAYILDRGRLREIDRYRAVELLEEEAGLSLEEA